MKIFIAVNVIFEELDDDGEVVGEAVKDMRSRRYEVHNSDDLRDTPKQYGCWHWITDWTQATAQIKI